MLGFAVLLIPLKIVNLTGYETIDTDRYHRKVLKITNFDNVQKVTNSFENGIRDIQLGNTIALLDFPPEFGMHVKNRMIYRNWVDNETLRGTTITVETDNSSNSFFHTNSALRIMCYLES